MMPTSSRLRKAVMVAAILTFMAAEYWAGYRVGYSAGQADTGQEHRFLVVVTRSQGSPSSGGSTFTYYNIRNPGEAAKLAKEEDRLKSIGVDYYVAKGRVETTVSPEPDVRRVNAHR